MTKKEQSSLKQIQNSKQMCKMRSKQDTKYVFDMLVKKQKELEQKLWLYDFVCER